MPQPPRTPPMAPESRAGGVDVVDRKRQGESGVEMLALVPESCDPSREYRWVRSRADEYHSGVSKARRKGYRLEKRQGGVKTVVESDDRADDVIAIGDLVLMSAPKDLVRKRRDDRFRQQEAVLASASAETEQMAKDKGVRILKDPQENLATQE